LPPWVVPRRPSKLVTGDLPSPSIIA
jgi:hypothetical protein